MTTDNNNSTTSPAPGFYPLPDRSISKATAEHYGVKSIPGVEHHYPYYSTDGKIPIKTKTRTVIKKRFFQKGDTAAPVALFGQQLFPSSSAKQITLTEGECDAMAAFEMHGSKYPVVSVQSASQAVKDVQNNFEYLNSFDEIVICFDNDPPKVVNGATIYPGQDAAIAVAGMFQPGKVRIFQHHKDFKDANDYLMENKGKLFTDLWWKAPKYTPAGIVTGDTLWEDISNPPDFESISYPFNTINDKTYGLRLSELVIINAPTGVGKTTLLKHIEHHILTQREDTKVGFLHFEEPKRDLALGLMSIEAQRPLHLPDVFDATPKHELKDYYDKIVNSDRVVIWDHFGSNAIQEVINKVRYMANLGCKYIVIDHLSIIVSDQSGGDERKDLDEITTKIKTLCMELNISVIAVIHQNRQGLIRGTAAVEQMANIVLKLEREIESPDAWRRNVTKVTVQKNRFCGRTGPGCYLFYNENTGGLEELDEEGISMYEGFNHVNEGFPKS